MSCSRTGVPFRLHPGVLASVIAIALAASCAPGDPTASAEDDQSAVRQAQMATRVFRKLVGRDPSREESARLRGASLEQMVDAVLALPDFERDGFFAFQRDRLLLHRDGDARWLADSLPDYCALRLEMTDAARSDGRGAGYYEILRYRDRWLPLSQASLGMPVACLTLRAGDLRSAMDLPPLGPVDPDAGATDAAPPLSAEATTCAQWLSFREPFRTELAALEAADLDAPVLATEPGKKLVLENLRSFVFRFPVGAPPPEADPSALELPLGQDGRPALLAFDGAPSDRCAMVDAYARPPAITNLDALYLKVRVPPALEGVHASMYWLSRHASTKKNRDLHRARVLFFSYMCTEISPAMAAATGGEPQIIEELAPYFDPEDEHVKTSQNCYGCHTQVQPLANYFGELSKGASYGTNAFFGYAPLYHQGDGFRRPGGLWKGDAFVPAGAGKHGMEGLAELLSSLDAGHACIVKNTWSSMIGSGYPLTDEELAAAVAAFRGDGTFRFANLLRHLAVGSRRGKAFFEGGEAALAAVDPGGSPDCRDAPSVPEDAANAHETLLVDSCAGCHSGAGPRAFFERVTEDGVTRRVFRPERLVTQPGGPPQRYGSLAELYHRLYCKVWSGSMPLGGWDESDGVGADAKKKQALCFFGGNRNLAAKASEDPAVRAFDAAPCEGQAVPPAPGDGPHPIEP